jgi:hypothetical protein
MRRRAAGRRAASSAGAEQPAVRPMPAPCTRRVQGAAFLRGFGQCPKNTARQDCLKNRFPIWFTPSIFGRTTLAIYRYSRDADDPSKIRSHLLV